MWTIIKPDTIQKPTINPTDLNISIIASSLSFEDQLSFSKTFKKNKGCSPIQFRKNNRIITK